MGGGTPSVTWTADTSEQLVILNAAFEAAKQPVESAIDHPQVDGAAAVVIASQEDSAEGGSGKILLCATITPAAYDTSHDGYATSTVTTILAAVPLHQGRICHTHPLKLMVRPGASVELSLVPTAPVSAERFAHIHVTCSGTILEHVPPHNGWRPLMESKWFVVKPSVHKTTITFAPPHILSPSRRAGEVAEALAVSACGNHIMWANKVVSLASEVQPYRRRYTPARADKEVRVRRFPHRNADVIGFVPFGEHRLAVGQVVDNDTQELYVRWEHGGWSRTNGSGGPFLVEDRFARSNGAESSCTVFETPRLYTSSREGRGVRVRCEPNLTSKQIGLMEPNEVREAIALHQDEVGSDFVEWKAGGFSCASGPHGSFLFHMIPTQQLRSQTLRGSRGPPSPEIISLDRRKRSRENACSQSDNDEASHHLGRRTGDGPVPVGISPSLVPQALRDELADGKASLVSLPRVSMGNGNSDGSDEEGDSDFEDSSDEDEWTDEELLSSDDFDEDADEV